MPNGRKLRNVIDKVTSDPWLMHPEKLEEIKGYLELRANGVAFDVNDAKSKFVASSIPTFGGTSDSSDDPMADGVAVIGCVGTLTPRASWMSSYSGMTSTQELGSNLIKAGNDPDVKSIVLMIDSPGGQASGVAELGQVIARVGAKKRLVGVVRVMAASGGFWLAAACPTVYAEPSAMIGSHGVYLVTYDVTKANEERGVSFRIFTAGEVKAAGSPYKSMTKAEAESLQLRVDAIYEEFTVALAEGRNTTTEKVLQDFGQGTTFLAAEAAERNMIDGVMLFEDVIDQERSAARGKATQSTFITVTSPTEKNEMKITQRIRAAMFANGLIESMDAEQVNDDKCRTVLQAFFAGKGLDVPEDESKIIDVINGKASASSTATNTESKPKVGTDGAALSMNDVQNYIATNAHRVREIQAKGKLFGVEQEKVDAAVADPNMTVEKVCLEWSEKLAEREQPVGQIPTGQFGQVEFGASSADKHAEGAAEVLASRHLGNYTPDEKILNGIGNSLRNARMIDICRNELKMQGREVTYNDEADALAWMQSNPGYGDNIHIYSASVGTANSPAQHADVLSNLQGKMLESPIPTAPIHYMSWMEKHPDLADFKPKTILESGIWAELDQLDDQEGFKEKLFDTDLAAWLQLDEYGNSAGLTVRMIANDDLGVWARQLATFPGAAQLTLQNSALRLLVGNHNMVDGNPQFAVANLNQVASGGAPDASQASEHRRLHRLQKNKGAEGANVPIGVPPSIFLGPAALEDSGLKTYGMTEGKVAQTDANKSTVVGTLDQIIFDAYLDSFSTTAWYTFISPAIHGAFCYAYGRGYGEQGQRSTWFDPKTRTRHVGYVSRFAIAVKSRRGVVYNPGS